MCVLVRVKNREEKGEKREGEPCEEGPAVSSIISLKDIGVAEFPPEKRQLFIIRQVGVRARSSHSDSPSHTQTHTVR